MSKNKSENKNFKNNHLVKSYPFALHCIGQGQEMTAAPLERSLVAEGGAGVLGAGLQIL
jgi:hypothetical protein